MGGTARLWDARTGNEPPRFDVGVPVGASWSPDGSRIAIADLNGNLAVYSVWQTLEELVAYANDCCAIRDLTPEERVRFGLPPR